MNHFRSTNLKKGEEWVKEFWLVCLDDKHSLIPAFEIYVDKCEEELNTLNLFRHKTSTAAIRRPNIETLTHSTIHKNHD